MRSTRYLLATGLFLAVAAPHAQSIPSARVAILLAEERGARDARDLSTLRAGIRNADSDTARAAIRALGRLARPTLVSDIAVALRSPFPELRAEAADAIGSAFAGPMASANTSFAAHTAGSIAPAPPGASLTSSATTTTALAASVASALSTLLARLPIEADPGVRAAIGETLGRIPYPETSQIVRAESALLGLAHSEFVTDRLGAIKGFELLIRTNAGRWSASAPAVAMLREMASAASTLPVRDARIRRLAFEALITAGEIDRAVLERGASDHDWQVRWLTMRAAGVAPTALAELAASILRGGLVDPQPSVRIEALRGVSARGKGTLPACRHFVDGFRDSSTQVSLVSLDLMGDCGADPEVVGLLERTAIDPTVGSPRGWHRPAHALVALSRAAPDRAKAILGVFTPSPIRHIRAYTARAASALGDRATLEKLAADPDDGVAQIAGEGLGLATPGQPASQVSGSPHETDITAAELQRLAAPKARVTINGVGTFELALFTSHGPAAVLRFARLAESGQFNGVPMRGVTPTVVSLMSNPAISRGDEASRPDETGSWPHVRGAVGLAPGGPTGEMQIFIDLVDNPRLDHRYPVFAQVLNGIELIDQILEGDIVERIEIVPGP